MKDQTYLEKVDQRNPNENVFSNLSSDTFKVGQLPEPRPNGDNLPTHIVAAATITGESITFHADKFTDERPVDPAKQKAETEKPSNPGDQSDRPIHTELTKAQQQEIAAQEKWANRDTTTTQDVNPAGNNTSHAGANHPAVVGH